MKGILFLGLFFILIGVSFVGAENCTDSDGGIDYYVKGTTSRIVSNNTERIETDSCMDDDIWVLEYYCVGNYVGSRGWECPGGCLDGVCVEKETGSCTDSDGGKNYEVKGQTVSNYCVDCTIKNTPKDAYDICFKDSASYPAQDKNKLFEYRCDEYGWFASESYDCPNFCHDGACVDEITEEMAEQRALEIEENSAINCDDPDGGKDIYVPSQVTWGLDADYYGGYWDKCVEGDTKIKEYYCEDRESAPVFEIINCPDGCKQAACIGPGIGESYCEDSDGGKKIYEKGLTKGNPYTGGKFVVKAYYDSCQRSEPTDSEYSLSHHVQVYSCSGDDCYVKEYFAKIEGGVMERCTDDIIKCPDGCEDGACLGDKPVVDESSEEEVVVTNQSEEMPKDETAGQLQTCNGCTMDGKCYSIGYREAGEYCNNMQELATQLPKESACENSFECKSNVCVNGGCISGGLIRRIMNWFVRLFGE